MDNNCFEKYSRLQWIPEQQKLLRQLKQVQNHKSWKIIANALNENFPEKNRNGKQCRQRYMNYVRFNQQKPKIQGWSQFDDLLLFDKFLELGPKWVQISAHIQGRSENCLKNRFYGALRKVVRKINKVEKQRKLKYKKSIKYETLLRIISIKNEENSSILISLSMEERAKLITELRRQIIKMAISKEDEENENQILCLIKKIHQLNSASRNVVSRTNSNNLCKGNDEQESQDKMESQKQISQWSVCCEKKDSQASTEVHSYEVVTQQQKNQMKLINLEFLTQENKQKSLQEQLCQIFNINFEQQRFPFYGFF